MAAAEKNITAVLLTGNHLRHRFVANTLAGMLELVGVVEEAKPPKIGSEAPVQDAIIRAHFAGRDEAEEKFFGAHMRLSIAPEALLRIPHDTVNSPEVFSWVRTRNPDYLILYGTTIVRPPLLEYYDGRIVNMHLGLSPYYRGAGTNFWPLVDKRPECVGVTVHLAVQKVDAGPILAQARPDPDAADTVHDLGCKTIVRGATLLGEAVRMYHAGRLVPREQDLSGGRVCKNKDFTADAVKEMTRNFQTGMMAEYESDRYARDARYPIVTLPA